MLRFNIIRSWFNGPEYAAKLEAAGKEGARLAAEYVADRARYYCPVDTGALRASIKVISSQGGAKWHVVATMKYARYVEWGSMHGSTWIAPNPFMRRAFSDGRKQFPGILRDAMVRAMPGAHLGGTFSV